MPQTAVTQSPEVAMEGMLNESAPHFRESLVCDESAGLPFGRACMLKSGALETVDLPAGVGEAAAAYGIVARNPTYPADTSVVLDGDGLTVVRKGIVSVTVEDAVVKGASVFVRGTAGASLTVLGRFRSDDGDEGGGALAAARPDWEYLDNAIAGGFSRVWIK